MKLRQRKHAAEENIEDYLPKFDEHGMMQGTVRKFGEDPESETTRRQSTAEIRAAISRLPAEYRIVLVARDIDDLSSEETAEALGLTHANRSASGFQCQADSPRIEPGCLMPEPGRRKPGTA